MRSSNRKREVQKVSISESKLIHHLDRFYGEKRPVTADVFITNYCNAKCPFCTYGRWDLADKKRYTPLEDFKRYATRLVELGVKGIILTGGGEPTIHPQFTEICKWLEDNEISYGINTNFIVPNFIKPDYIKISLDGHDAESYKAIKGVDAYEKVRENVKAYAEFKKRESPKTNLGIQKIVTSPDEIIPFYEANKDLDVDYIVFRPIESTLGEYYWEEKHALESLEIIDGIDDERVVANYKWKNLANRFDSCLAHWSQIALNENGEVMYCCHKPYEIVGHILDEDILKKHAEAKTNMNKCDVPCRLTAPNELVRQIVTEKEVSFI